MDAPIAMLFVKDACGKSGVDRWWASHCGRIASQVQPFLEGVFSSP